MGDLNAELAKAAPQFPGAFDVDRVQPEQGNCGDLFRDHPEASRGSPKYPSTAPCERVRCSPATYRRSSQPPDRFLDLVGGENSSKAGERSPARPLPFSRLPWLLREFLSSAVQEELAVLGIKTGHIGRKDVGGEVGRRSQNALAGLARSARLAFDCHRVNTLILFWSFPIADKRRCVGAARLCAALHHRILRIRLEDKTSGRCLPTPASWEAKRSGVVTGSSKLARVARWPGQ